MRRTTDGSTRADGRAGGSRGRVMRLPGSLVCRAAGCLLITGVMVSCGGNVSEERMVTDTTPTTPAVSASQLLLASAVVALPPEGVRPEDLPDPESPGARHLHYFCTACHALPSPAMHSATDWPGVVRRMWLRISLLPAEYRVPFPETGERVVLLQYLLDHALQVSAATIPDAPGRSRFVATCAQCHELPDPRQHSPVDWFVVVRRMTQHMQDILGQTLTDSVMREIVLYLDRASS